MNAGASLQAQPLCDQLRPQVFAGGALRCCGTHSERPMSKGFLYLALRCFLC